jgi:hypothetical protein
MNDLAISNEKLKKYKSNGFPNVEGWCGDQLFHTFDLPSSIELNKTGGCCEIGVHHGKLYILLNQLIEPSETSFAIDVFDQQNLNIDSSGCGSLEIFRANLERYDAHSGHNTKIIVGDSTDPKLRLEETIGYGALRFMSIDGSHTVEHTLNDLYLANKVISNEGVVIQDDILSYHWPGVIEGLSIFLNARPTLVPFALGHNKLYLCKVGFHRYYLNLFSQCPLATKLVTFFGYQIVAL